VQVESGAKPTDRAMSSATRTRGLRERKKQRTRELIADTALELFLERGFDAVTIAEIAQRADVDVKTIYNYFPSKPDLFYHRLEAFGDTLINAVRMRGAGESVLSAFGRFVLDQRGMLADPAGGEKLRAVNEMILASPALLAHEEQVYAGFTASLAALLAEETDARPADVEPWVIASALIGLHRALVAYVRNGQQAGTPHTALARGLRSQAKNALATLERGLGSYGTKAG
jgi:AcrR family transcriptional regulator